MLEHLDVQPYDFQLILEQGLLRDTVETFIGLRTYAMSREEDHFASGYAQHIASWCQTVNSIEDAWECKDSVKGLVIHAPDPQEDNWIDIISEINQSKYIYIKKLKS